MGEMENVVTSSSSPFRFRFQFNSYHLTAVLKDHIWRLAPLHAVAYQKVHQTKRI